MGPLVDSRRQAFMGEQPPTLEERIQALQLAQLSHRRQHIPVGGTPLAGMGNSAPPHPPMGQQSQPTALNRGYGDGDGHKNSNWEIEAADWPDTNSWAQWSAAEILVFQADDEDDSETENNAHHRPQDPKPPFAPPYQRGLLTPRQETYPGSPKLDHWRSDGSNVLNVSLVSSPSISKILHQQQQNPNRLGIGPQLGANMEMGAGRFSDENIGKGDGSGFDHDLSRHVGHQRMARVSLESILKKASHTPHIIQSLSKASSSSSSEINSVLRGLMNEAGMLQMRTDDAESLDHTDVHHDRQFADSDLYEESITACSLASGNHTSLASGSLSFVPKSCITASARHNESNAADMRNPTMNHRLGIEPPVAWPVVEREEREPRNNQRPHVNRGGRLGIESRVDVFQPSLFNGQAFEADSDKTSSFGNTDVAIEGLTPNSTRSTYQPLSLTGRLGRGPEHGAEEQRSNRSDCALDYSQDNISEQDLCLFPGIDDDNQINVSLYGSPNSFFSSRSNHGKDGESPGRKIETEPCLNPVQRYLASSRFREPFTSRLRNASPGPTGSVVSPGERNAFTDLQPTKAGQQEQLLDHERHLLDRQRRLRDQQRVLKDQEEQLREQQLSVHKFVAREHFLQADQANTADDTNVLGQTNHTYLPQPNASRYRAPVESVLSNASPGSSGSVVISPLEQESENVSSGASRSRELRRQQLLDQERRLLARQRQLRDQQQLLRDQEEQLREQQQSVQDFFAWESSRQADPQVGADNSQFQSQEAMDAEFCQDMMLADGRGKSVLRARWRPPQSQRTDVRSFSPYNESEFCERPHQPSNYDDRYFQTECNLLDMEQQASNHDPSAYCDDAGGCNDFANQVGANNVCLPNHAFQHVDDVGIIMSEPVLQTEEMYPRERFDPPRQTMLVSRGGVCNALASLQNSKQHQPRVSFSRESFGFDSSASNSSLPPFSSTTPFRENGRENETPYHPSHHSVTDEADCERQWLGSLSARHSVDYTADFGVAIETGLQNQNVHQTENSGQRFLRGTTRSGPPPRALEPIRHQQFMKSPPRRSSKTSSNLRGRIVDPPNGDNHEPHENDLRIKMDPEGHSSSESTESNSEALNENSYQRDVGADEQTAISNISAADIFANLDDFTVDPRTLLGPFNQARTAASESKLLVRVPTVPVASDTTTAAHKPSFEPEQARRIIHNDEVDSQNAVFGEERRAKEAEQAGRNGWGGSWAGISKLKEAFSGSADRIASSTRNEPERFKNEAVAYGIHAASVHATPKASTRNYWSAMNGVKTMGSFDTLTLNSNDGGAIREAAAIPTHQGNQLRARNLVAAATPTITNSLPLCNPRAAPLAVQQQQQQQSPRPPPPPPPPPGLPKKRATTVPKIPGPARPPPPMSVNIPHPLAGEALYEMGPLFSLDSDENTMETDQDVDRKIDSGTGCSFFLCADPTEWFPKCFS